MSSGRWVYGNAALAQSRLSGLLSSPTVGGRLAPQIAAVTAIGNQARKAANMQPIGDLNTLIYGVSLNRSVAFSDVAPHTDGTVPSGVLQNNRIWDTAGAVQRDQERPTADGGTGRQRQVTRPHPPRSVDGGEGRATQRRQRCRTVSAVEIHSFVTLARAAS